MTFDCVGQCYQCGFYSSETNQFNICRQCHDDNQRAKIEAANIRAAASNLADVALKVECLENELDELANVRRWASLPRMILVRFSLYLAEIEYRRTHRAALATGLHDGASYAARLSTGEACQVFLNGPCVAVDIL